MAKRTKEQNRAIYERRTQRARDAGLSSYGQQRRLKERAAKSKSDTTISIEKLESIFPGIVHIEDIGLTPDRQRALDRLAQSKRFTPEELEALRTADREDFWPIYRDLYQRLVM